MATKLSNAVVSSLCVQAEMALTRVPGKVEVLRAGKSHRGMNIGVGIDDVYSNKILEWVKGVVC